MCYLPNISQALNSSFALNGMKLKDRDLETIVLRVTKYKLPTRIVASQFKISQRRVQQIVSLSRTTGNFPKHKRPGRRPYAVYPVDFKAEIIRSKVTLVLSASGIAKHLRKKRYSLLQCKFMG